RNVEDKQAAQSNNQIARVPPGHAPPEAEEETLNRHHPQTLLEQEIAHPQRQHRAETVTNELEGFEQGHVERISGSRAEPRAGSDRNETLWPACNCQCRGHRPDRQGGAHKLTPVRSSSL